MPRDITVTLSDGRKHVYQNAPDDVTPEAAQARAEADFGAKVMHLDGGRGPAPEEPAGVIESSVRDLVGGFGKSASMAPRAVQMLAGAFGGVDAGMSPEKAGTPANSRVNSLARSAGDLADSVHEYWTAFGKKSTNPSLVKATLSGAGGAAAAPVGGIPGVVAGAGAGLGEGIAEKFVPGNPVAAAAGGLAGGLTAGTAAAMVARARPQSANVAKEAMEGITEAQLYKAQEYMNRMKSQGTEIDLAQALTATGTNGYNMTTLRNFLANRKQGNQVQGVLDRQPQQLGIEASLTAENLPGKNFGSASAANHVQETATDVLKAAKADRSAQVKELYGKAGLLAPEARDELIRIIQTDMTRPGASEVLKGKAADAIRKLSGKSDGLEEAVTAARNAVDTAKTAGERATARAALAEANSALNTATGKPIHALDVDRIISELRGPWKGEQPLKIAYPYEAGEIKGLAGKLNNRFQELSPEVRAAEDRFKVLTREQIDPLTQGPVGRLNQNSGYDPATQAIVSKFTGMMDKGVDSAAKVSEVKQAFKELGSKDPSAVENAFKSWISEKIAGARVPAVAANAPPSNGDMAKRISAGLFENDMRWQGIKDATAEMAKVRGDNPVEVIRGLENLRQLTTAMKNRPDKIGGVSPTDLNEMGGASNIANAMRVFSFLPVNKAAQSVENMALSKTLSQFDTILTSPEGAKMLIALGKVPVMSRQAQVILGTFGGAAGNSDGLSVRNPPE